MFKLRLIQRQDCRLYKDKREDTVQIVCHCPALAWKRYRTLGRVFLIPKALENMRVNDYNKPGSRYQAWHSALVPFKQRGDTEELFKIYVSLGLIMEGLAFLYCCY
jgi:hypothetical protein